MLTLSRSLLSSVALLLVAPLQADWSEPVTVIAQGFQANPQVAINKTGRALAVYATSDTSFDTFLIGASTLINGVPSAPHIFPLSNSLFANFPNVSLNKHDNAALVWVESLSEGGFFGTTQVVASSFVKGYYSPPTVLSNPATSTVVESFDGARKNSPVGVNIGSNGDGIAVWTEQDSNRAFSVKASRLEKREWKTAELIFSSTHSLTSPVLAGNAKGDVLVVWIDTTTHLVQAAQFKKGIWQVKTFAESNVFRINVNLAEPACALNESGDGIIAWEDNTAAVQAARLSDGKWHDIRTLSDFSLGTPAFIDVSINDKGDAVAIWNLRMPVGLGTFTSHVQAASHVNGRWLQPVTLIGPTPVASDAAKTLVSLDSKGQAVASVGQLNTLNHDQIEAFTMKSGKWGPLTVVSNPQIPSTQDSLGLNGSGKAILVWVQGTPGSQSVQSSVGRYLFKTK